MTQWLLSNTGLKVVSLVLAIFTWFFVKNMTSERRLVEGVMTEIKTKPTLAVLNAAPATVNVVVRGTHADIWQLARTDLAVVVDLRREEQAGKIQTVLLPKNVKHPPRVQIVQVAPPNMTIQLAAIAPVDHPSSSNEAK